MPPDHEKDGILAAAKIKPIQGKIVVAGIGMSNWDAELCNQPAFAHGATNPKNACAPWSFIGNLRRAPNVNPQLIVVDCAQSDKEAKYWANDDRKLWTQCNEILAQTGIAPGAVQILLYKNANANPRKSLTPRTACATGGDVDACALERTMGQTVRFAKKWYPNLQQAFVHSRIYSYGTPDSLNPEPFAYETGFACKWLIEAQIDQVRIGKIDPVAGNLSYAVAPWIAWGPYFWANGPEPRSDGADWMLYNYSIPQSTHPEISGVQKVVKMMMQFYLTSPVTPWFRK